MRRQSAFECPDIERPRQSRCVSIEYHPLDPVRNAPFGVREYRACGGWSSSTIEAHASPGAVGVLTVFSLVKYAGPMNSNPRLGLKRCADVHLVAGAVRSKWAERHSSSLVVVAKLEALHRPHEVRWQRRLPEIVQYRGCQLYSLAGFQAGPEIAALAVILNSRTTKPIRERPPSGILEAKRRMPSSLTTLPCQLVAAMRCQRREYYRALADSFIRSSGSLLMLLPRSSDTSLPRDCNNSGLIPRRPVDTCCITAMVTAGPDPTQYPAEFTTPPCVVAQTTC